MGVTDLVDPFVDGEGRTDGEQDQGDHERPEVALAAVAEWMGLGGVPTRPATAEQQQGLVGHVGHRMDGLGQHGR